MATSQNTAAISINDTFVSRAAAQLRHVTMRCWCHSGLTDEEVAKRIDAESDIVQGIAQSHAATPHEVLEKLRILCGRIRTHLEPVYPGAVLDYVLAEGARSDLEAWILRAEDTDADRILFNEIERLAAIRRDLDKASGPEMERLSKLASDTEQEIVQRAAHTPAGVLWKARRLSELLGGTESVTEFMRSLATSIVDGLADLETRSASRRHAGGQL